MKVLIASDLHGSAKFCRQLIEAFTKENADKLLLLGDVLYHGPRNPLPDEYAPQEVVSLLETVKDKIICVRGNCDADIDKVLLPFPLISDLGVIFTDGLNIYFAHGHLDEPPLSSGDVYVTGHTHVQLNTVKDGHYHLNPGSLSLPKEDSERGYIVYENRKFLFKNLEGETIDELEISEKADEAVTPVDEPADEPAVEEKPVAARAVRPQVIRRKFVIRKR